MGLLVPEIDHLNLSTVCERLEAEFQKAVIHHCDDDDLSQRLSLSLRIYPEPWKVEEAEHQRVDPLFFPENRRRLLNFRAFKRGVDVILSLFLLFMLSPLLLILAALVKLSSPGPVIFRQVRVGRNMKPFMMCKFRTMYRMWTMAFIIIMSAGSLRPAIRNRTKSRQAVQIDQRQQNHSIRTFSPQDKSLMSCLNYGMC